LKLANLSEADLRYANLRGADLKGTNLRVANLSGTDLRGAKLGYANLRGADLRDTNLRVANLGCIWSHTAAYEQPEETRIGSCYRPNKEEDLVMHTENHMVIGDPYPKTWEEEPVPREEVMLKLHNFVNDNYEYILDFVADDFISTYTPAEMSNAISTGDIKAGWNKLLVANVKTLFKKATGEEVTTDEVLRSIANE